MGDKAFLPKTRECIPESPQLTAGLTAAAQTMVFPDDHKQFHEVAPLVFATMMEQN